MVVRAPWCVVIAWLVITGPASAASVGTSRPMSVILTVSAPESASEASDERQPLAPDAVVTVFEDSFEGTFPGVWEVNFNAGTANILWGLSTYSKAVGARAVWCAAGGALARPPGSSYVPNMQNWMRYGPFSLADATAAQATFQAWIKTEPPEGSSFYDYLFYGVSLNGTNFEGTAVSGDLATWQGYSLDFADPGIVARLGQTVIGKTAVWFLFMFVSDSTIVDEGAYLDSFRLDKTVGPPCSLACSASVPASGNAGQALAFNGSATPSNCTGSVAYSWVFGDGTAVSTQQNTTHAYTTAGTYSWRLATAVQGVTCEKSGSVTIAPACSLACAATVPVTAVAGTAVEFQGSASPTGCGGAATYDWDFGDGSAHSAQASPNHTYTSAGTYSWRLTTAAGAVQCIKSGTITVAPPCSLSCTVLVPPTAQRGVPVSFAATVTPSNCGGAMTYDWDFGDGSAHGAQANLTHAFASAGSFPWRFAASSGSATCAKIGTVIVHEVPPLAQAGPNLYLLSSVGHLAGASGSNWVSDVGILNPGSEPGVVNLYLLKKGHNNSGVAGRRVELAPGQAALLPDVVLATFGEASASGGLLLGSRLQLIVTSRTYNTAVSGTYGQYIEGYPAGEAVTAGEEVRLLQLSRTATFRTNLGFVNAGGTAIDIGVDFVRADGTNLGRRSFRVSPWGQWQETDVLAPLGGTIEDALAVVRSDTAGARYFAYASVIDGRTNDPVQVVPVGRRRAAASASPEAGAPAVARSHTPCQPPADADEGMVASHLVTPANEVSWFGITGAPATTIAVHPNDPESVWMGTKGSGLWRTTDGGATWSQAGLAGDSVWALDIHPLNPNVLYAATRFEKLKKSVDGGVTWTKLPAAPYLVFPRLALDPVTPSIVYTFDSNQVWKSSDGGTTWVQISSLPVMSVSAIVPHPTAAGTLFAAGTVSSKGALAKSVDGGATWSVTASGLPVGSLAGLAIDRSNPAVMYAGTSWYHWEKGNGVLKSTNGGVSWSAVNSGLTYLWDINDVTVDPHSSATVYAATEVGVFKSVNGGASWSLVTSGLAHLRTQRVVVAPSDSARLYAATGNGIFRSTNAASSWVAASRTVGNADLMSLAVDPGNPRRLWVGGGEGGVWRSSDGGATWTAATGAITSAPVYTVVLHPANPSTLYVSTWGQGVFKSSDGGATWGAINSGISNFDVRALAVDPMTPAKMYAGCYYNRFFSGSPSPPQFYTSGDGGSTWTGAPWSVMGDVHRLFIDPRAPSTLYAINGLHEQLSRSLDSGTSWATVDNGMGYGTTDLAIDPTNSSRLFAAGRSLFASADGGGSWSTVAGPWGTSRVDAVALDPHAPATIYVSSAQLLRSADGGGTWTPHGGNLGTARTLVVDAMDASNVLGVTWDRYGFTAGRAFAVKACPFALSASTRSVGASGGTGSVEVTVPYGTCPWSATSDSTWLAITAGASGTGPGTVAYSVAANTDPVERTGRLAIAGQVVTVTQAPGACSAPLAPVLSGPAGARSGEIYTLSWSATSPDGAYELQEALDAGFTSPSTVPVSGLSSSRHHTVQSATTYHARVRATDSCGGQNFDSTWSNAVLTLVGAELTPPPVFVPGTAHLKGAATTNWRTDLEVHNPGSTEVVFDMALLQRDRDNPAPVTVEQSLAPGSARRFFDVLDGVFAFTGAATLRLTPHSGTLAATSRTYNDQPGGSFGQFVPGMILTEALAHGELGYIGQLSRSADPAVGFRANLGLVNATEATVGVKVETFNADGVKLGARSYSLGPYKSIQLNDFLSGLTAAEVPLAYAVVRTTTVGGRFFAYASVVDNRSGDPVFIPARSLAPAP